MLRFNFITIICVWWIGKIQGFTAKDYHLQTQRSRRPSFLSLGSSANNDQPQNVKWNPAQASEFLTWNIEDPEKAGLQLAPMIKKWSGKEVGEFLTRMYLGEVNQEEYTISYHPSNVRNPQWLGMSEDGLRYLTLFLLKALPTKALTPHEISRFADYFLLKEHIWPTTTGEGSNASDDSSFESDSFGDRGHGAEIARVIGFIRRERLGDFSAEEVISLLTLPEDEDKNRLILNLNDFFRNIGIKLTSMEKIMTVEGGLINILFRTFVAGVQRYWLTFP
jgi:hypothetical protein